jgi:hypothetical protein
MQEAKNRQTAAMNKDFLLLLAVFLKRQTTAVM